MDNSTRSRRRLTLPLFFFAAALLLVSNARKGIDLEQQIDLAPTYIAAHLLWQGNGSSIYRNSAYGVIRAPEWIALEKRLMSDRGAETTFVYMPAYLWLVMPFALLLNFYQFKVLFILLKIPCLAYFFTSIASRWPGNLGGGARLIGTMCLSDAVVDSFRLGQNIEFLAFLIPAFFVASGRDKRLIAVLLFILAVLLKPWAAVLLLYPMTAMRKRLTGILLLSLGALLAFQWVLWPEEMSNFVRLVADHSKISILSYNNLSLAAFIHKLSFGDWMNHFGWTPAPETPAMLSKIIRVPLLLALGLFALLTTNPSLRRLAILMIPPAYMNIFWNHYLMIFFPFFADAMRRIWHRPVLRVVFSFSLVLTLWADTEVVRTFISSILLRGYSIQELAIILPFIHLLSIFLLTAILLSRAFSHYRRNSKSFRSIGFLRQKLFPGSPG